MVCSNGVDTRQSGKKDHMLIPCRFEIEYRSQKHQGRQEEDSLRDGCCVEAGESLIVQGSVRCSWCG